MRSYPNGSMPVRRASAVHQRDTRPSHSAPSHSPHLRPRKPERCRSSSRRFPTCPRRAVRCARPHKSPATKADAPPVTTAASSTELADPAAPIAAGESTARLRRRRLPPEGCRYRHVRVSDHRPRIPRQRLPRQADSHVRGNVASVVELPSSVGSVIERSLPRVARMLPDPTTAPTSRSPATCPASQGFQAKSIACSPRRGL